MARPSDLFLACLLAAACVDAGDAHVATDGSTGASGGHGAAPSGPGTGAGAETAPDGTVTSTSEAGSDSSAGADPNADTGTSPPDLPRERGCSDSCLVSIDGGNGCGLWDEAAMRFVEIDDGPGQMHNRARRYATWLRERLMPAGGVMRGVFDPTLTDIQHWAGTRDSPIWTGIYLGAEALRYQVTGSTDALVQVEESVRTLHRWWRVSGDQGYLARYAAPADSPADVLSIFNPPDDPEFHFDQSFEGEPWHWRGNISRDQYQGVVFGYALAYDVLEDEELREMIRSDMVELVEQLMKAETRTFMIEIDGFALPYELDVQYVIYTDDETDGGGPEISITTGDVDAQMRGFLTFWPNAKDYLGQIPLLAWFPDITQNTQGVQLGGMFATALHVTESVPAYAARRAAIQAHYDAMFPEWFGIAAEWDNTNNCGDSYHGINIAFLPAFNWARLEADPTRRTQLQTLVLRDRLWAATAAHKNVFFALVHASQAHPTDDVDEAVAFHLDQLADFPPAPNTAIPVDNTGLYAPNPQCEGLSAEAIDVQHRVPSTFMWERQPWKLIDEGTPNLLYSGVDYLVTYWMARAYGFLEDDAPGTCMIPR